MTRGIFRLLKKNNRGVALIELTIVFPILLILALGIVEFGWILNGYITVTGSAREGARAAIVGEDYQEAVEQHIESLTVLSLKAGSPSISGGEAVGDELTVRVDGTLPLLIGFFEFFGDESIELRSEVTMRREYADEE